MVPLNPAYNSKQVATALKHVDAACFVISSEIYLPFRKPQSTSTLLQEILESTRSDGLIPKVLLVDNSGPGERHQVIEMWCY